MQNDTARTGKIKLIAWIVIIAAVAILYIGVSSKSSKSSAMRSTSDTSTHRTPPANSNAVPQPANTTSKYKDGTYSASASYRTPDSIETIDVTLQVAGGVVTDASVHQVPTNRNAQFYQEYFAEGYKPYVIGKKLSDISLSRISGSSLTPQGFDDALDQIKSQAAG